MLASTWYNIQSQQHHPCRYLVPLAVHLHKSQMRSGARESAISIECG